MKYTILVVGAGNIAAKHLNRVKKELGPSVEIFVCSRKLNSAEKFLEKTKTPGKVLTRDEVTRHRFDGALICSPPLTHGEWITTLAPVSDILLLEKPAVCSSKEISKIDNILGVNSKCRILIGENYDFKPITIALEKLVEFGKYGKLKKLFLKKTVSQKAQGWKAQCGSLFEGGIHFVSMATCIAGQPDLNTVQIQSWRTNREGVERGSRVKWDSVSGVQVEIEYAWDSFSPSMGIGQISFAEFENKTFRFESNGLWLEGAGFFLNDTMGNLGLTQAFIRLLQKKDQTQSFRSSWLKSKTDLDLVFKIYQIAKSEPVKTKLEVVFSSFCKE